GGSALATALVYLVGSFARDGATPVTLALAGTAVTAGVTSVITLILLSSTRTVNTYRFWSVGSLAGRDGPGHLATTWALAPFLLAGLVLAVLASRQLNLVAMGADLARGLGVRLGLTRVLCAAAVVLLAGTATALAGPIVFVGLVVPHLARSLVGPDYRWILGASLLLGPVLLLAADVLGRLVIPRDELEAGLVVAAVGAPAMIAIIRRVRLVQVWAARGERRRLWQWPARRCGSCAPVSAPATGSWSWSWWSSSCAWRWRPWSGAWDRPRWRRTCSTWSASVATARSPCGCGCLGW